MLRLSNLMPRKALYVVALTAIVGVLWSGAGVDFWMAAACSDDLHLVSPLEKGDNEPLEAPHKKDKQQDAKIPIPILMEKSARVWRVPLLRPFVEVLMSPLHHPDVLTPPPEC